MSRSQANRLRKTRTFQGQQAILTRNSASWESEQSQLLRELKSAVYRGDHDGVTGKIRMLEGLTKNRFESLNTAIPILCDPDRVLKDVNEIEEIEETEETEETKETKETKEIERISGGMAATDLERWRSAWRGEGDTPLPKDTTGEIVKCYNAGMCVKEIADYNDMNPRKIVKILVTMGVYSSETYDRIKDLRISGKSDGEIANLLGIRQKTMSDYTPYKKGIYGGSAPTENALRIRKCRQKKC